MWQTDLAIDTHPLRNYPKIQSVLKSKTEVRGTKPRPLYKLTSQFLKLLKTYHNKISVETHEL